MLPYLFNYIPTLQNNDYLTANMFSAFIVAFVLVVAISPRLIPFLSRKQGKGQPIREDGPQTHLAKVGTPTMGGLIILGSILIASFLFNSFSNPFIWVCWAVILVYGLTGFVDDWEKVTKQTSKAMSAKMKLILQFSTAFVAILIISLSTPEAVRYGVNIPYFSHLSLNLWWFYIPFAMVVITGTSNAVNLSDGLDGLASGLCIIAFAAFMIIAYSTNNFAYANELCFLCAATCGALVGFLWFNAKPARIFMGDVGAIALGALLGTISVILKSEILLAIIGGVFVLEALSVMMQVYWFKKTGKRVFKMAPIHHHFEQLGWEETNVVIRFWIISLVLAVIGLISLNMS